MALGSCIIPMHKALEMNVFNASVATETRANGAIRDAAEPPLGKLNPRAMTSLTALAGTNGVDACLIHADLWNQIEGNVTENILKNHKLTVTENEKHTITGNLTHRVVGTTNDTRVAVHNQTNIAQRNDEFMHTRTEIHHQPEKRVQKTDDIDWTERLIEFTSDIFKGEGPKMTTHWGPDVDINPIFTLEMKGITAAWKYVEAESVRLECEFKELAVATGLVRDEIKGAVVKVAGSHLKGIGANLNAGIAANADSPFA